MHTRHIIVEWQGRNAHKIGYGNRQQKERGERCVVETLPYFPLLDHILQLDCYRDRQREKVQIRIDRQTGAVIAKGQEPSAGLKCGVDR